MKGLKMHWQHSNLTKNHSSSHWRCSVKKGVLRNEACNFVKKETLAQMFSCEFYEISKNNFFTQHLWTTGSGHFYLSFRL